MRRSPRRFLLLLVWWLVGGSALAAGALPDYPVVVPGVALRFPADYGAHPAFRTEWWYITGWLHPASGEPLGFQVTFFRSRPSLDQRDPSRFAPKQLIFAHAALADPKVGRLLHDQRAARAGFDLAGAAVGDTRIHIGDWSLARGAGGRYRAVVQAREFTFDLTFKPTEPVLPEGDAGYSRKGPSPAQASYYYSMPQLAVVGTVTRNGARATVTGTAWLDHEWSSEVLAAGAVGWDWTGINFDDGGALMAFRIRDKKGAALWAGGTLRAANGHVTVLPPSAVAFAPEHWWRSPRTDTNYPIAMRLRAGDLTLDIQPLMADQELDTRASTGAVYWEGAVSADSDGRRVGRGYLELTGYFQPLHF